MDVFQGAVLSVQNSFGKLFSDVVTDVKDTVDCTILAVEHILSLSEDATARYYKKCASAKNDTKNDSQQKNNFPVLEISIANNEEYLKKELPAEIDDRINATLIKILNGYNPHDELVEVQKELAKETERLADVSDLVRQELDKLSKEIRLGFTNVERKGYKPSVDSILGEIKVLEEIEQNIRNSSEANEIHQLVGNVLNKLHEIESSGAKQNNKIDGILRDLEKSSNRSYKDMRQQLEDWKAEEARHLNVIKAKMDEHENVSKQFKYAKMDNTFTTIEPPKIGLVPVENEIASRTIPLNSKNIVESMLKNIVTKQISRSPKIAIQPLLDATSPVQINDASGVVTPVSISTSSYVNEINVDVTETSTPQRFQEKPIVTQPLPDLTLNLTTPITIAEKSLNSTNLATLQPTIELLDRTLKPRNSHSVIIPQVTYFVPNNSLELNASPSVPTTEPNISPIKKTQKGNTSVQKMMPQISTFLSTPMSGTQSSSTSNTYLGPSLDLKTSLRLIRNHATTQLENLSSSTFMTPETNSIIENRLPEEQTSAPKMIIELTSSTTMKPEPIRIHFMPPKTTASVSVMSPQSTISAMAPESSTTLLVTAHVPTKSSTMTTESTTSISVMTPESTTIFTTTPEPNKHLSMVPTERDSNPSTRQELIMDLPVLATESATSSPIDPETTLDLLVTTVESTKNPETTPELITNTNLQGTTFGKIINTVMIPKSTTTIPVSAMETTTSTTLTENLYTSFQVTNPKPATSPTKASESTIDILVMGTGSSINPATTTGLTTDLPELYGSTKNSVMSPAPATSLLVTTIAANESSTTNPEQTTTIPMMTPKITILETTSEPTTSIVKAIFESNKHTETLLKPAKGLPVRTRSTMFSEFTKGLLLKPPESTTSLKSILEPRIYPSTMTIERDTSPTTTPEPTRNIPVTAAEPTTSSKVGPESTMYMLINTNPGTTPELRMDLQVTAAEKAIKSVMMSTSTINIPMMTTDSITNPTMIPDSNTSLPVMASKLTSVAMKPEPTTNPLLRNTEFTTNLTTTLELATHLPPKTPERKLEIISKLTTDLPVITSESLKHTKTDPISNMIMINSDVTTGATNTLQTITSIPVMIPHPKSSVRTLEPIRIFPVTVPEPTTKATGTPKFTTKAPRITTEFTTYHLVKTTDITRRAHVTSHSPKIIPEATTSLTATVRESTNSLATNHSVLDTNSSVSAFKTDTSSSITPEPITNRPVSTSQKAISTFPAKSREPSMSSTVTILEPTTTSIVATLGRTSISKMKVPEPITKQTKILRETTTGRSIISLESSMSSTETITKSTTDLLRATSKSVTKNQSNFQHPFILPTHGPGVSTPSLKAFLKYIDRKEGFMGPDIQSTIMTTTVATTVGVDNKILPHTSSTFSRPRSAIKNGPINAKLNDFFSHLPSLNTSSPYARNDYAVPMNRTGTALLKLTSPKIGHDMPPKTLNKNAHAKPLSLSHLKAKRPFNESPYSDNNPTPHRRNHENTPIPPSARLPTNLSRSLGLTTYKPVPTPKINHYDDSDYKSFFHNSYDAEAHSRALNEAKKIIEESKRAHGIINNIFNKKNKGRSALNFSKS